MKKNQLAITGLLLAGSLMIRPAEKVVHAQHSHDLPKPMGVEAFTVIRQFLDYDRGLPLDARTIEKVAFMNHIREKIVFTSNYDERVPGYLAIPEQGESPYPVVIYCHGGGGSKEWGWQANHPLGQIVQKLLSAGYCVLSLDGQHSGERLYNNDYEPAYKYIVERKWYARERNMIFQTVIDYRRGIDYLSSRSEIDLNRIAVDGFSFGSIVAYILTAVDPRVKVASLSGLPVGRKSYNWDSPLIRKFNFIEGITEQPLLLQLGKNDPNILKEDVDYFFSLLKSKNKALHWYESGHGLPQEYQEKVLEWLKQYL